MDAFLKQGDANLAAAPAAGQTCESHTAVALDEEDRRHDDTSEGIDWDNIIASTQDDWEAGRYKTFDPADYPTEEAFIGALKQWMDSFLHPNGR